MNFEMAETNVRHHVNEIRDQASQSRVGRRPSGRHPSGLRGRVGLTLVEAGLHLLAADGSQSGR